MLMQGGQAIQVQPCTLPNMPGYRGFILEVSKLETTGIRTDYICKHGIALLNCIRQKCSDLAAAIVRHAWLLQHSDIEQKGHTSSFYKCCAHTGAPAPATSAFQDLQWHPCGAGPGAQVSYRVQRDP